MYATYASVIKTKEFRKFQMVILNFDKKYLVYEIEKLDWELLNANPVKLVYLEFRIKQDYSFSDVFPYSGLLVYQIFSGFINFQEKIPSYTFIWNSCYIRNSRVSW